MNNLDTEIINLKNEILALKTSSQIVANQLRTTTVVQPIEFTLTDDFGTLTSTQYAEIIVTPETSAVPLISFCVDISDLEDRKLYLEGGIQENGTFKYAFNLQDTENATDISRYQQGQTVKITYNVVFISTSNLTTSVNFIDKDFNV